MTRYARQEVLPQFGPEGQAHLAQAHMLVVGAGGLGCPALQYLVGAGVGQITIVDPDTVSRSNLHRQILFSEKQVGTLKAKAAVQVLTQLNSDSDLQAVTHPLTPDNVDELLQGVDVVLDCADSFAVSYILSDAALAAEIPLISASALGVSGYVGGFCATAPSLRAVFPDLPASAANCATAGVMGPVVGTLGAMQAQMAMNVVLQLDPSPLGQMMQLDLQNFRATSFRFDTAPEPQAALRFVSPKDVTQADFAIELRTEVETRTPFAPHAQRLSVAQFKAEQMTPDNTQRAVFTCKSGLRAWQAARHLQTYWSGEIALIAMGDTNTTQKRDVI